jgi:predicted DNA-binding antitoxin AbrB/MazE fold protein
VLKTSLRYAVRGFSKMPNTIRAIVREGKIELLEKVELPEGTEVLVTPLSGEADFWLRASEGSLAEVWDNSEDDAYAELLTLKS